MNIYETSCTLKNRDVNLFKKLKTSRLFEFLQEASIAHTEELGAGREKTLDRGLLWVVVQQEVKIIRFPEYDEPVRIVSWPGNTMHVLFPRFYRLLDAEGSLLAEGSALWALMDGKTRRFVFPEANGVSVPGIVTSEEYPLPLRIAEENTDRQMRLRVPFSWCDLNGHMNNTRYFDLMDDLLQNSSVFSAPELIRTEYHREVRYGEELTVLWKKTDRTFFMKGITGEKAAFRIYAEFGQIR